jgi:hypothetical protein
MRLLAIKLETDDFLLSELFEAEESEEEIDQLKQKRSRLIYERPDYTKSNWWKMLEKGECKILTHREYKVFRRRFSVSFPRFASMVREAREWTIDDNTDKKFGDVVADCTGTSSVPLELKILGCLRMSAKGVCFDAIAELSGMSISAMHTFYHIFWKRFCEKNRDSWIHYPTSPAEAAENLEVYRRLGFPGIRNKSF